MRLHRFVALLVLTVLLSATASHAAFACGVRSSHVSHCDRSQRLPDGGAPCCRDSVTVAAIARASAADFVLAPLPSPFNLIAVAAPNESRSERAPSTVFERTAKLRLHLLLSSLIV